MKTQKQKDVLLEKVSKEVHQIAFSLYNSEQEMMESLAKAFFPKIAQKNLLPQQAEVIETARTSLNGKILTALLEEKPVDNGALLNSLVDEATKRGITETINANRLPDSAVMELTLLVTKQIREMPYLNAFKPEDRERLLKAIPITVSTFQPKLPLMENAKGATVINTEAFLEETLIRILNLAQQVALDPADRIEVKVTVSAESKEIDVVKFGEFVRAGFGKKPNAQAKKPDSQAAENYKKIMTDFYDEFSKELLEIPKGVTVEEFSATPDFKKKMETLSRLSSDQLQKKITETIETASQKATLDGGAVKARKVISDIFKSEIHPGTGLVRRTTSTDRAQIIKDDFTPEVYFSQLSKVQSDQVQYSDPDDASRTVNQNAMMTAAHKIVTTLHALVNVRPKLILEAQKAKVKEAQSREKKEGLALNLKKAFPDLLNDPKGVDLGKSQNTKSLETQLENHGIKPNAELSSVLVALKKTGAVSKFATKIAEKVNQELNLPTEEVLGRYFLNHIGVKANNTLSEEIGKSISNLLRNQDLKQIAKGEKVNVSLPSSNDVLFNVLKATGALPDDLEQVLKKPLSAEGVVFTEEDKEKIKAQVLFGLIPLAKTNSLPVTGAGKTDVAKFNVIFNGLANKAYLSLHPISLLPFIIEADEREVDYDITKRIPDLMAGIHTALEDFMQGDLTNIVGLKLSDLLDVGMRYLKSQNLIEPGLENHTRKYFESVINALEPEFLSKLRAGKKLDEFASLQEMVDTIVPAQPMPKITPTPTPTIDNGLPPAPPSSSARANQYR